MRKAIKAKKPLRGATDPRHGTSGGYGYWGCRCQKCREYAYRASREFRDSAEVTKHGSAGYDLGCRCQVCTTGKSTRQRERCRRNREWRQANRQGTAVKADLSALA